jgi:sec-independent protein translocase protein TatA
MRPGPFEVLVILFVILLLFGAKKLPELSRSLGRSLGEFRKGREEAAAEEETKPAAIVSDSAADKPEPPASV